MRGHRKRSGSLFSYVLIEERIPASHPLRRIRKLAEQALDRLNPTFCALYAAEGRPSVPPEKLLLAWASHASLERIDGQEDPPPMPLGPGEGFGAPKTGKKRAKGDFRGIKVGSGMSSSIPSCSPRWLRPRAWPIVGVGSKHPQAAHGPPGAYAPGGSSTNSCVTTHYLYQRSRRLL
jgi:hypothetical protein